MERRRLTREEVEEIVREELDEELVRDIGEEGVEATVAGLMILDAMLTHNCSDEAFDEAMEVLDDIAEGRIHRWVVNCNNGVRVIIERSPDGKINVDVEGDEE